MNKNRRIAGQDQEEFIPIGKVSKLRLPAQLNLAAHFVIHGYKDIRFQLKHRFRRNKDL